MSRQQVETVEQIKARVNAYTSRFATIRGRMAMVERWTDPDPQALKEEIWGENVPDDSRLITEVKPHAQATRLSVVAILTGREPKMTVVPRNPDDYDAMSRSTAFERLARGFYDTVNQYQEVPLITRSIATAFDRAYIVGRWIYETPEERGEARDTETIEAPLASLQEYGAGATRETGDGFGAVDVSTPVDGQQVFPLRLELLDPLDCFWTLSRKTGKVIEFIHEYTMSYIELVDQWPDIERMNLASRYRDPSQWDKPLKVIDYWDETNNAILIEDELFKKPTPHKYRYLPFHVETVNPIESKGPDGIRRLEGRPFCLPMIQHLRSLSWAESLLATHMNEAGLPKLTLHNVDPETSFYVHREGPKLVFDMELNLASTDILAFAANKYGGERFEYLQPSPIVPIVERMVESKRRDLEMLSFAESMLSGAQAGDLAGYAIAQMKQLSFARVEPIRVAINRFWSIMMTMGIELVVEHWDYMLNTPLSLVMTNARTIREMPQQVSLDDLKKIGAVEVVVTPYMPLNRENEVTPLLQQHASGALRTVSLIDKLGEVDDPEEEFYGQIAETYLRNDPRLQASIAYDYYEKKGITILQPNQQQAPAGGMPPGGAGENGQPPNQQQIPPEVAALMAGGGSPLGGGQPVAPSESLSPLMGAGPTPSNGLPPEVLNAQPRRRRAS